MIMGKWCVRVGSKFAAVHTAYEGGRHLGAACKPQNCSKVPPFALCRGGVKSVVQAFPEGAHPLMIRVQQVRHEPLVHTSVRNEYARAIDVHESPGVRERLKRRVDLPDF